MSRTKPRSRSLTMGVIANQGAAPTYTISGTVFDADGITLVSGATVALGALTATSAADGAYTISNVPAGASGSMTCTKTGYLWAAKSISAMSGNLTSQNYTNVWYKSAGLSLLRAWMAKGAASKAASLVNLANPGTGDLTEVGTIAWDATNGWQGAAGSNALNCNTIPANLNYTYGIRFSSAPSSGIAMGWTNGVHCWLYPNNGSSQRVYHHSGANTVSGQRSSGVMIVAGPNCYLDGVADGTISQGAGTPITPYLLGRNNTGTPATTFAGGYGQCAFMHNGILTPTQVSIISAAMAALP